MRRWSNRSTSSPRMRAETWTAGPPIFILVMTLITRRRGMPEPGVRCVAVDICQILSGALFSIRQGAAHMPVVSGDTPEDIDRPREGCGGRHSEARSLDTNTERSARSPRADRSSRPGPLRRVRRRVGGNLWTSSRSGGARLPTTDASRLRASADHPGRISRHDRFCRNVLGHHASGPDGSATADGHPRQHRHPDS